MDCLEFEQNLPDLLYQADPEAKAHRLSCPQCAAEWASMSEIQAVFKGLPERVPHSSSIRHILQVAGQKAPRIYINWDRFLGWLPQMGGIRTFAPAMMVVLLFVSLLMAVSASPGPELGSASPPTENFATSFDSAGVLRERLSENPFAGRRGNEASGLMPGVRKVSLDGSPAGAAINPAELEKVYQERRRSLLESDADSLMMRGRRLKTMGHMDMALKDFETIYLFYPDYTYMSDVLMYRAQCYAALGEPGKAVESLKVVAKRYPDKKDLVAPLIDQLSKQHQ